MKKSLLFLIVLFLFCAPPVLAVPFLQLDISGAVYDSATQTVFATSPQFSLYALVDSTNSNYVSGTTYYISAAVTPQVAVDTDLGSFSFDGNAIDVTGDMQYGTAPIDGVAKNQDLPNHGIFPTYFTEFSFNTFTGKAIEYNSMDNPGQLTPDLAGTLNYAEFLVDGANIDPAYAIHFDFYTKNDDGSINKFAPFSHDGQSGDVPVPEPATLLLVGAGMLGVVRFGKKRLIK